MLSLNSVDLTEYRDGVRGEMAIKQLARKYGLTPREVYAVDRERARDLVDDLIVSCASLNSFSSWSVLTRLFRGRLLLSRGARASRPSRTAWPKQRRSGSKPRQAGHRKKPRGGQATASAKAEGRSAAKRGRPAARRPESGEAAADASPASREAAARRAAATAAAGSAKAGFLRGARDLRDRRPRRCSATTSRRPPTASATSSSATQRSASCGERARLYPAGLRAGNRPAARRRRRRRQNGSMPRPSR